MRLVFAFFFVAFWAKWRTYAIVLRIFEKVEQDFTNWWKIGLSSKLALVSVMTASCFTGLTSALAVSCFGEVSAFSEVCISLKTSASPTRILWSSTRKLGHLASGNWWKDGPSSQSVSHDGAVPLVSVSAEVLFDLM